MTQDANNTQQAQNNSQQAPANSTPDPAQQQQAQPAQAPAATATAQAPTKGQGRFTGFWNKAKSRLARIVDADPGQANTSVVAAPTDQELASRIEQLSISADTPLATIVQMLAGQTQDVAEVIESYDEHKEHAIGQAANKIGTVLGYVFPWVMAFYAGAALGFTYSNGKPFNPLQLQYAFYYIVSWAYEFCLVLLMLAIVRQFKRVKSGNKRAVGALAGVFVLFLVLAVTSASAQWILFEHVVDLHDTAQLIGALFRTLGTPLTDLTCAIGLSILHSKSLDEHLLTMQKKTDATIAINKKKIGSNLDLISAAIDVKNTLQKEEDYRKKNELANTIVNMFSESAIETIRQSLEAKTNNTGSSYRRDGYR